MTRVTIDGETYACPFADLCRPMTPEEAADLEASIIEDGIVQRVLWYYSPTWGRAIIAGVNRVLFALKHGREIRLDTPLKIDDDRARRIARAENRARRHLSPAERQALRSERVKKIVAEKAATGASNRAIAAKVGVSESQVRADLQTARAEPSGAHPCAPEPPATVTGRDGKIYPATAPKKKSRPTHTRRAHSLAGKLLLAVRGILRGPHRPRLAALAEAAGVPVAGTDWPALDAVRAVLRDLDQPGASA